VFESVFDVQGSDSSLFFLNLIHSHPIGFLKKVLEQFV
jgi:hypothetical protein